MRRLVVAPAVAVTLLALGSGAAPAATATTQCGSVKGVGNGTSVTRVTKTSGTCAAAKVAAKVFARGRTAPPGFTCRERLSGTPGAMRASVTCKRPGRTVTFKVAWNGSFPLPPASALPSAGAGG